MIVPASYENIEKAAAIIVRGGLVGMPTETVYGLAADAFNAEACARIFEVKKRPFFDPLIVHIADREMLSRLTVDTEPQLLALADAFWPGPLTLVLPKSHAVPDIVTSGLDSVAIRMPRHETALALITAAGTALAAPSANPFGYLSPTSAAHVEEQLGADIDMILDGGPCIVGVESTIVRYRDGVLDLLRPGGITVEDIERVSGLRVVTDAADGAVEAPGQMPWHYAPRAKLTIIEEGADVPQDGAALCAFRSERPGSRFAHVRVLSPAGNIKEAAANLFAALRSLDASGVTHIYAEAVDESGLGRAIMNRLRKAAAR